MPQFYAPLDPKAGEKDATYYQVLVGGGALFEVKDKVKIRDVKDGTVNTLMVVEADRDGPMDEARGSDLFAGTPAAQARRTIQGRLRRGDGRRLPSGLSRSRLIQQLLVVDGHPQWRGSDQRRGGWRINPSAIDRLP